MVDETPTQKKYDLLFGSLYLIGFVLFFEISVLPYLFLFAGGGGFDNMNFTAYFLYGLVAVIPVLFDYSILIARIWVRKGESWFTVWVHQPEEGLFAKVKDVPVLRFLYRTNKSVWLLALLTIIVFLPLVALGAHLHSTQQTSFVRSIPETSFPSESTFTSQQVTSFADFGLAVWPASPSESIQECSILAMFLLISGYFCFVKGLYPKGVHETLKYTVIPLLGATYHLLVHLLRYGSSDVALQAVFTFGLLSAFLFVFFASMVPAIVYHEVNNAVYKLFSTGVLGSQLSFAVLAVIEFFLIVAFVYSYSFKYHKGAREARHIPISGGE